MIKLISKHSFLMIATLFLVVNSMTHAQSNPRPRARDLGLKIGVLPVGNLNSITDVEGVLVGQKTITKSENIRTGVTAILPHGGNLFRQKVPGAVYVGNGFGKLAGSTQVNELGEIETPILLTSTLSVPKTADFLLDYMLMIPGNENVRSINPLVAETNDGTLNDIRGRHVTREDVFSALKNAKSGVIEEGAVGAGTGTVAFGFKGGIGTSSRKIPASLGGYTVGVLVQTNYGGVLSIDGAPVGVELGKYYLKETLEKDGERGEYQTKEDLNNAADGSVIIVVATDAPIDARQLKRLAARSIWALAKTGSTASNGSGDYSIAFSTAPENRIDAEQNVRTVKLLSNDAMSPLFAAVIEATEEAVYNSLFGAVTTSGNGRTIDALPLDETLKILRKYGKIK